MLLAAATLGCAPYEHHDAAALADVTRRFAAAYVLHAGPEPAIDVTGANLLLTVSFESSCAPELSEFVATISNEPLGAILIASRHEPECRGAARARPPRRVSVPLPAGAAADAPLFVAFPPGSEYELWRLRAPLSELAPPCPPAALRLYIHRATPKVENRNGPCSTMLEVEPSTPLAEVLALASMRLGVNVDALRAEDDDEAGLELLRDGAHLVAYEAAAAPPPPTSVAAEACGADANHSGALESCR